jgi:hypothetical protein
MYRHQRRDDDDDVRGLPAYMHILASGCSLEEQRSRADLGADVCAYSKGERQVTMQWAPRSRRKTL